MRNVKKLIRNVMRNIIKNLRNAMRNMRNMRTPGHDEKTMIMFSHLDNIARPLVPRAQPPRHIDEAKVRDDRSAVL